MSDTKLSEMQAEVAGVAADEDPEAVEARAAFDTADSADDGDKPDDNDKTTRKHGRSFIYLSLEDAESAVRKIDEHEKRMSKRSFSQALGHKKPVGRFRQKLAALESYDLVSLDGDDVLLTELAVDMLYGPTEQARTRARAKAFLSYELFKRTFVECPKNQDHQMSYVEDFVRVTLKIVNEGDMFMKRFLESAAFAGLLDGEPNPKANTIRLRPAVAAPSNGDADAATKARQPDEQWVIVPPNEEASLLDSLGLTAYQEHSDVSQRSAGEVAINMADGKITVEVRRPVRVAIKTSNMLSDVTEILKALQSKGFKT